MQDSIPEPTASSAQVNVIGTGWPCVNTYRGGAGQVDRRAIVSIRNDFVCSAEVLPLKSCAIHFSVPPGAIEIGSGSARARGGLYSVDAVVGVEPSVV